jgi:hypothetical protein
MTSDDLSNDLLIAFFIRFDLAARVLKLAFQLSAMCSQRSRSDDPTEAHAAVELADLHACNFLFAMLHRSLSTFRYVGLSTEKKHVTWHTVRRCADALRTVSARAPAASPADGSSVLQEHADVRRGRSYAAATQCKH